MAALLNGCRASAIKEPLIQHPVEDSDPKDVENGERMFGADISIATPLKPQEPNIELFADSVKYSSGTSDAASIDGIKLYSATLRLVSGVRRCFGVGGLRFHLVIE
jgi:hypothetical protein